MSKHLTFYLIISMILISVPILLQANVSLHVLLSDGIVYSDPVYVRYAWGADNPEGANLYNAEGLPASPFEAHINN